MKLLNESKKNWLLSSVMLILLVLTIHYFAGDKPIGKTVIIMIIESQLLMIIIIIWVIAFYKWKKRKEIIENLINYLGKASRIIGLISYLGITVYECIIGNLSKWYIVVPLFIVIELYTLWMLGGIVNCILASYYKDKLSENISYGKGLYREYEQNYLQYEDIREKTLLDKFFKKNYFKAEPAWEKIDVYGIEMFEFEIAFCGINTNELCNKTQNLREIIKDLREKNNSLSLCIRDYKEKGEINTIAAKAKDIGIDSNFDNNTLGKIIKNHEKSNKKIQKRKIKNFK